MGGEENEQQRIQFLAWFNRLILKGMQKGRSKESCG